MLNGPSRLPSEPMRPVPDCNRAVSIVPKVVAQFILQGWDKGFLLN